MKFRSREELEAFFDNDKLQCFLCDKELAGLQQHLRHAHSDITVDEYKEMFGIPFSQALWGKFSREKLSAKKVAWNLANPKVCEAGLAKMHAVGNGGGARARGFSHVVYLVAERLEHAKGLSERPNHIAKQVAGKVEAIFCTECGAEF